KESAPAGKNNKTLNNNLLISIIKKSILYLRNSSQFTQYNYWFICDVYHHLLIESPKMNFLVIHPFWLFLYGF
ncbi:hypothetical protein OEZ66_46610, partial [Escherichia coli]|nr:hypothetical protein [Escherichia coli]